MKRSTIILFLVLGNLFLFGQKKELYLNDDLEYISKTEFNKKHLFSLDYNLRFDLDSCFINVKVSRYKEDKINQDLYDSIVKTFISDNSKNIENFDCLLINYYPGNDPCSSNGYKTNFKNKHKEFHKKISKLGKIKHLFIYKTNDGLSGFGNEMNWQPDVNNLIKNTFYPIHYPCGGYVIIDSKGNYISERGEYCYGDSLIQKIEKLINTK